MASQSFLASLSDLALLKVTGSEKEAFLHGQFTSDIINQQNNSSSFTAWCNPKGQVIVTMLVIKTDDIIFLLFKTDQKDYVLKRLSMFVLRADVKIEDVSNKLHIFCSNVLIKTIPESTTVFPLPDKQYYLYLSEDESFPMKMADDIEVTTETNWQAHFILAGYPWLSEINKEKFLPQMLNLDQLQGLSYKKGCYPGQEVIARLHYRGEVKRRLQVITSKEDLTEGSTITDNNTNAGTIINAVKKNDEFIALAVIDIDKLDENLKTSNGESIKILATSKS